jgi:hypothetical protein
MVADAGSLDPALDLSALTYKNVRRRASGGTGGSGRIELARSLLWSQAGGAGNTARPAGSPGDDPPLLPVYVKEVLW